MKRLLAILLCVLMLAGCVDRGDPYVPTGDGLHQDVPTEPKETQPEQEKEITLAYYPDRTMNPYTCTNFTNRALFSLMYQGLFAVGADYTPEPILCKSFSVNRDMTKYTFYLEDATFSDGTALTAQDVVASLLAAKKNTVYSGRFTQILEITAMDDGSVEVLLAIPYENLPLLLDVPIVKASEVEADQPLGTGPYYLKSTIAGLRLYKQSRWWCKAKLPIDVSQIALEKGSSPSEIRDHFQFADVSLVCADPGSDTFADFRCDYELWECENGIFLYLGVNSASPVFANDALRGALTHVIDRNLLVADFYRGFAKAATLPASPDSPWYDRKMADRYGYAPERFYQAVADAEMTGQSVVLLVNTDDTMRIRAARAVRDMLTAAGLKVTMSEKDGEAYRKALEAGTYDLYLGQTKLSPNMDLSAFYSTKGGLSYGGLANAALLALCWDSMANTGNFLALHQKVMEDAHVIPILFRSYAIYAKRGTMETFDPARDNLFCYSLGKTLEEAKIK